MLKNLERPTTISGSWPFSMISWLSFGYHRERLIAVYADASNVLGIFKQPEISDSRNKCTCECASQLY
jgi:hypothetical protein